MPVYAPRAGRAAPAVCAVPSLSQVLRVWITGTAPAAIKTIPKLNRALLFSPVPPRGDPHASLSTIATALPTSQAPETASLLACDDVRQAIFGEAEKNKPDPLLILRIQTPDRSA